MTSVTDNRQLHVISGENTWCRQQACTLLERLQPERIFILSSDISSFPDAYAPRQYAQALGCEFDCVVMDCFCGLDPDALGAVSGTLRGGGLMLMLVPELEDWPGFPDPDYARHGYQPSEVVPGYFIQRLIRMLETDPSARLHTTDTDSINTVNMGRQTATATTPDQLDTIEAIKHVADGHAHRPLVVKADRGRGKSTAIGLAAAELLQGGKQEIVVTAPWFSAVETLFQHAACQLAGFTRRGHSLMHEDGRRLVYIPPDVLLDTLPDCDLLCIDEAAAIPAPLLEQMLRHYNRLIFSTSVHGYEGSGRGFDTRFRKILDAVSPQWREQRLFTPIRWKQDDRLEQLIDRLLLLDAETAITEQATGIPEIECYDQVILAQNEPLLRELFSLLVSAHYRTRPFDLRQLLDGKGIKVYCATITGQIIGVAVTVTEQRLEAELVNGILDGSRRPRGNLAQQQLAHHCGIDTALKLQFERIMRIAVDPACRRQGIASKLLQEIVRQNKTDLLSTSFGATPELLDFWAVNGFELARVGLTRDASSSSHSVLLLRPCSNEGKQLHVQAMKRFEASLPHLLNGPLQHLDASIASQLLSSQQLALPTGEEIDRLRRFANGALAEDAVLPELDLLVKAAAHSGQLTHLSKTGKRLLIMRVVQRLSAGIISQQLELEGKRAVAMELRKAVNSLLDRLPSA